MSLPVNVCHDALQFIERNLDQPLNLDTLCRLFGVSKYHFHRQFSLSFGIPLMSLIRLLRLKRAAYQLAYRPEQKVLDIALSSGYDSHEAFARSFKRHFQQTPSAFRQQADWQFWQNNYEPLFNLRSKTVNPSRQFRVETVSFDNTALAVLEHRGAPAQQGSTLQNFIAWRKANHTPPGKSRTFNLVYHDPATVAPEDYRFDIACTANGPISPNPQGVNAKTIPGGLCAMIRHIGNEDSLGDAVCFLYTQWLPASGYQVRDFPLFFERVRFFPEVPEAEMITDIYLPIY